LKLRY